MLSLAVLIDKIIDIYTWIVIASAIMSWLVAFGVVNVRNQFIRVVVDMLFKVTEPVLRPIRRILPNLARRRYLARHPPARPVLHPQPAVGVCLAGPHPLIRR